MAGPSDGAAAAAVAAAVVAVPSGASDPEAVLGRGFSAEQAPAMVTATRSRTRPESGRRALVIVGDLRSRTGYVHSTLRTGGSRRMSIEIGCHCGFLSET